MERFSGRRPMLLAPPAAFFLLSLLIVAGAPNSGSRWFYAAMVLVTLIWLIRCWRVEVALTTEAVVLRGQLRTRQVRWQEIKEPETLPMQTASPLRRRFPYVCLALRLVDGRLVRFDDFAAAAQRASAVELAAEAIRGRLASSG